MLVRDLQWLVVLADTGHLTEAAAILGTTQPTLSRALARVERELGVRLFERLPGGVRANPDGELVVAGAREVVARHEALLAQLAERLDPAAGLVRLAFLDSIATSLVPRVLGAFHAAHPQARVQLRQEPAHVIADDLAHGGADLAITSPHPGAGHGWAPLQQERLVLAVPPGHRWAGRRRVDGSELAELSGLAGLAGLAGPAGADGSGSDDDQLITTPVGFGYRRLVDGLFARAGAPVRVGFESVDLTTIEGLVAAGLGVAVLPEQIAGATGSVGVELRAQGARRTIGLTWRLDRDLPPAALLLREVVTDPARRW